MALHNNTHQSSFNVLQFLPIRVTPGHTIKEIFKKINEITKMEIKELKKRKKEKKITFIY